MINQICYNKIVAVRNRLALCMALYRAGTGEPVLLNSIHRQEETDKSR